MKKAIIVMAAALLALPLTALAQKGQGGAMCDGSGPGPMGMGMGQGMHRHMPGHDGRWGRGDGGGMALFGLMRNADAIGLTDKQKADIKKMVESFQIDRIDRQAALDKAEVKLRGLMMDDKAVENDVLGQIDQVSKLKADLQKMRYQHHKQIQNVLTDEQKAKLKELRQTRMQGNSRSGGHKGMPGRGMGHGMKPGMGQGQGQGQGQGDNP
jgi:Spy/CpxP family protein refolding chaperone